MYLKRYQLITVQLHAQSIFDIGQRYNNDNNYFDFFFFVFADCAFLMSVKLIQSTIVAGKLKVKYWKAFENRQFVQYYWFSIELSRIVKRNTAQ